MPPSEIRDLLVEASNGAWVILGDVTSVEIEAGSLQIHRDDLQRRVVTPSNVDSRDIGRFENDLCERIYGMQAYPFPV